MKFFITLLFIFVQITCFAETKQVDFFPNWKIGESYNFKVNKSYELIQKGVTDSKGNASYNAKLSILDKFDNHYLLKLTLDDYRADNQIGRNPNMNFDSIVFLQQPVHYIYKITRKGEFIELVNWEKISERYTSFFNKYLKKEMNDQELVMFQQIINSIKSKSRIENNMIDLHYGLGSNYKLNQPQKITGEMSNPFDSNPLIGTVNIELTEVNKNLKTCTLNFKNDVDSEMLSKSTYDFIDQHKTVKEIPKILSAISLKGYYTYDCKRLIPLKFETTEKLIVKVKDIFTIQNIVTDVKIISDLR